MEKMNLSLKWKREGVMDGDSDDEGDDVTGVSEIR